MKMKNKILVVFAMAVILLQVAGPAAAYSWAYDARPFEAKYQPAPSGDAVPIANTDGTCTIAMASWKTGAAEAGVMSHNFITNPGVRIYITVTFRAYLDAWIDSVAWGPGAGLSIHVGIYDTESKTIIEQRSVYNEVVWWGDGMEVDEYFSTGEYTEYFSFVPSDPWRIIVYMHADGTSAEIKRDSGSSSPAYFFVYSMAWDSDL